MKVSVRKCYDVILMLYILRHMEYKKEHNCEHLQACRVCVCVCEDGVFVKKLINLVVGRPLEQGSHFSIPTKEGCIQTHNFSRLPGQ